MRKGTVQDPQSQSHFSFPLDPKARAEEIRSHLRDQLKGSIVAGVYKMMVDEVKAYCGEGFDRKGETLMHRGGSAPGSVYYMGQRIPIQRLRVRSAKGEKALHSYEAFRDRDAISEEVARAMLHGVSTRDYSQAFDQIAKGSALCHSAVSSAFKYATQKHLDLMNGRSLKEYTFAAFFFDGIHFAGATVLVALGVTEKGEKLILGLREGASENSEVCKDLIESLIERGLAFEGSMLVVIDGSKALKKAIQAVWADRAIIARCRIHKMRNVLEYLSKSYHAEARRRLNAAWGAKDYETAKTELLKTARWLRQISESAASSLEDGLEESLVMHKLNLPEILRKSLSSTNVIESAFSIVEARTSRVKNWRKGKGQVMRWAAAGLLVAEKRMHAIRGYKYLPLLTGQLKKKVEVMEAVA